jgi:DNA ligase (NAD+)
VAAVLAEHFGSIEELRQADVEQLSEINEIGQIIAESVFSFLHGEFGSAVIDDLATLGVDMTSKRSKAASVGRLAGKTLVVTGTLEKYGREEIERMIAEHGGRAASSVSKHTDYLVAGAKAGSKLKKAQELGVPVLDESQFEQLLNN